MTALSATADLLKRPDLPLILEQVNHLLKDESTRRHAFREWLDEDKKAEFINGEVLMHSPVKSKHLKVSENLSLLLGFYTRKKKLGRIMIEKALIALTRNDYEPDLVFFTRERAKKFTDDQMIFPAPDFVVEILSKSTAKNDRGIKKVDYAAHGVREYWIIDPDRQELDQYLRVGEDNEFMPPKRHLRDQTVISQVISGFEIPLACLFDEESCEEVLQQMTATPDKK